MFVKMKAIWFHIDKVYRCWAGEQTSLNESPDIKIVSVSSNILEAVAKLKEARGGQLNLLSEKWKAHIGLFFGYIWTVEYRWLKKKF